MYDRMIREHGYSVRRLAQKIGKDKGYLENRLRLADAPEEVRQLVSLRKDTLSHAYELMKVEDPRKRRRLADQVARGELSLVKLRERIEGRPPRASRATFAGVEDESDVEVEDGLSSDDPTLPWEGAARPQAPLAEDSLVSAKQQLAEAIEDLVDVLRAPDVVRSFGEVDRANLAKYLTITKLRLENAIAMVRGGER
jgi:ParB-like chromosome segregation protein Spo0J